MSNVLHVLLTLFALFYVNYHIGVAAVCNCPLEHPQTTFCNADFAIFAEVVGENRGNGIVTYELLVKKVFKLANNLTSIIVKNGNLEVISKLNSCPTNLIVNQDYYLTGKYNTNQAELDGCELQIEKSLITNEQKWGFMKNYESTCETCGLPNPNCPYSPTNLNCYSKYAICMQRSNNNCNWRTLGNQELNECLVNLP